MQFCKGVTTQQDCSCECIISLNPMALNTTPHTHPHTPCSVLSLQACQYSMDQNLFSKLGSQSTIEWQVIDESNFTLTYTGGDPIYDGVKNFYTR